MSAARAEPAKQAREMVFSLSLGQNFYRFLARTG
jgi:hypothetical protein